MPIQFIQITSGQGLIPYLSAESKNTHCRDNIMGQTNVSSGITASVDSSKSLNELFELFHTSEVINATFSL